MKDNMEKSVNWQELNEYFKYKEKHVFEQTAEYLQHRYPNAKVWFESDEIRATGSENDLRLILAEINEIRSYGSELMGLSSDNLQ